MLASELIKELEDCIEKFGDVEVVKTRAGLSVDHVYIWGVKILLQAEEEYIGDDIVRFNIDYLERDKIARFVVEHNCLDLLYDYTKYGKVSLKLETKRRHQIKSINDSIYILNVGIEVDKDEDINVLIDELKGQNIKDINVFLQYKL